jgi:hypothetical protein
MESKKMDLESPAAASKDDQGDRQIKATIKGKCICPNHEEHFSKVIGGSVGQVISELCILIIKGASSEIHGFEELHIKLDRNI